MTNTFNSSKFRWSVVIASIIGFLTCYSIGFVEAAVGFIVMGVLFELLFWFSIVDLFKKVRKPKKLD